LLWLTLLGFISFCLASSSNYIINDIKDIRADQHHPEKKRRALASHRVSITQASLVAATCLLSSLWIATLLSDVFLLLLVFFIANSITYTLILKDLAFLDLFDVSINFGLRSVAGAFVVTEGLKPYIVPSAWLLVCALVLAFFLASAKRAADANYLGKKAVMHKKVYALYDEESLRAMTFVSGCALLSAYVLYSFSKNKLFLFLSIPFAAYCLLRYWQLINSKSGIPRQAESFYKDWKILSSAVIWSVFVFLSIYFI
jgi:4-hydroxybenzoate polyprenyltransferase